ncbi:MAG TPA: hypothetical protein VKZ56_03065, partial [Membranihabitans sp.]|nr:hypothetical protein [Membranihabitans sp.]
MDHYISSCFGESWRTSRKDPDKSTSITSSISIHIHAIRFIYRIEEYKCDPEAGREIPFPYIRHQEFQITFYNTD